MLFDWDGKKIVKIPFPEKYKLLEERLEPSELEAIRSHLDGMIDGTEIQTAGWMPGKIWLDTPFEVIYTKAARKHQELAAKLFGLLVWEAFIRHPEKWTSGRFEKDGKEIGSRTYFRLKE